MKTMKPHLVNIKCPICNSKIHKHLRTDNNLDIVRCICGLCFVNPQPDEKYVTNFYNNSYYYTSKNKKLDISQRKSVVHVIVAKHIMKWKKSGNILDIGCGDGSLLAHFPPKRYDLSGTEYSDVEIKKASKIIKNIYKGDYLEFTPKHKYDAIIMTEVLEHTREPFKYIKKIHRDLKNEGMIIITVPNNEWVLMKGYKNNLVTNLHLFYFDKNNLERILMKAGFKEIHFIMNLKTDFYENYLKTAVIQVAQIVSYIIFKIFRINIGRNLIVYAKK